METKSLDAALKALYEPTFSARVPTEEEKLQWHMERSAAHEVWSFIRGMGMRAEGREPREYRVVFHNPNGVITGWAGQTRRPAAGFDGLVAGDLLWVGEAWGYCHRCNGWEDDVSIGGVQYKEDRRAIDYAFETCKFSEWLPGDTMPREFSRLLLRVTDVCFYDRGIPWVEIAFEVERLDMSRLHDDAQYNFRDGRAWPSSRTEQDVPRGTEEG